MRRSFWFLKDGIPCDDMAQIERLLGDPEYKRVAETTLPDGKWISTVWLGLNHRFGGGPPLIFETMVFPALEQWDELDADRYSTEEEAHAGHKAMVEKWSGVV